MARIRSSHQMKRSYPVLFFLKINNQPVSPAYSLRENKIFIHCDSSDLNNDSISVFFKVFPFAFHERITLWDSTQIKIAEGDVFYNPVQQKSREELIATVTNQLEEIQKAMFEAALAFREAHTHFIDSKEEFLYWSKAV